MAMSWAAGHIFSANLSHLLLTQYPPRAFVSTLTSAMFVFVFIVSLGCIPSQVVQFVVCANTVIMASLMPIRARANKRFKHQAMDKFDTSLLVLVNHYNVVACSGKDGRQYSPIAVTIKRPYDPKFGNGIPRMIGKSPDFYAVILLRKAAQNSLLLHGGLLGSAVKGPTGVTAPRSAPLILPETYSCLNSTNQFRLSQRRKTCIAL